MTLKELLPFCSGLIRVQAITCDGQSHIVYGSDATVHRFVKFADFEVYEVKARHYDDESLWLSITVKEYHVPVN